jgi:hypothetical protein
MANRELICALGQRTKQRRWEKGVFAVPIVWLELAPQRDLGDADLESRIEGVKCCVFDLYLWLFSLLLCLLR